MEESKALFASEVQCTKSHAQYGNTCVKQKKILLENQHSKSGHGLCREKLQQLNVL